MTGNRQDDPMMKAAALEGLATNPAIPMTDRLGCAMQAIALLRAQIDKGPTDDDARQVCPYDCDTCHDDECPCPRSGCAGDGTDSDD